MKLNILLFTLLVIGFFSSCDDDPVVTPETSASFEIESIDGLTVQFKNTSKDAKSYTWSFGDGNQSTSTSPKHSYSQAGTYEVKLDAINGSTTKSTKKQVVVSDKYKKEGFIITSVASSSGGATYYGGYFDKLPSGQIDLSSKQAFQRLSFKANHKGYVYGRPTSGNAGLAKMAVNGKTNELETVKEMDLLDNPGGVVIVNDELGFLSYFGLKNIQMFNPMTMELIGEVDLSGAKAFPATNDRNGYSALIYNEKTGKIFASSYTNNSNTPPFYDSYQVWVEVIDVATKKHEKTITHENAMYPLFRGNTQTVIDEAGNAYIVCQGSYGIDQQIGPNANVASRPQIIRINANSEFDQDYAFNPINEVGFKNNFFQLLTSMVYAGNNKAYIIGTSQVDSPEILPYLQKLAAGTITTEEYEILVGLVLYTASMSIIEVDLNSKATKILADTKTAGFAYPYMYNYKNTIYTQMSNQDNNINGFFSIDPTNNTAKSIFNISAGGTAIELIDLSDGF